MASFIPTRRAFARERLTVSNAVKTLTASVYNDTSAAQPHKAVACRIQSLTGSGPFSFTEEGTNPTAALDGSGVGTTMTAGDTLLLESYQAITSFKAIRQSTDAILEVVYYR